MLKTCNEYRRHHVSALPTGVYTLQNNGQTRKVYCEMDTDNGGWTLVGRTRAILVKALSRALPTPFLL